jgi:hypothetical protein
MDGQPLAEGEVHEVVAGAAGGRGVAVKVVLAKRIIGRGAGEPDVFLEHEIDMEFIPPVGMAIFNGTLEHLVTEVEYDHIEGRVYAWTFPDDTLVREEIACTPQIRAGIWADDGYTVVDDDK